MSKKRTRGAFGKAIATDNVSVFPEFYHIFHAHGVKKTFLDSLL
jgi:hypothetical protein